MQTPWLEKEYILFVKHHNNSVNFLLHALSFPFLLGSVVVVTSHLYGTLISIPTHFILNSSSLPFENVNLTFGFFFMMAFFILYLFLYPLVAISLFPLLVSVLIAGEYFTLVPYSFEICLVLYNVCWAMQILAHIFIENSLGFENFVSAFALAPLIVWIDILYYFGFRPEERQRLKELFDKSSQNDCPKQHSLIKKVLIAISLIGIVAAVTAGVVLLSRFFSFYVVLCIFIVAIVLLQAPLLKYGW